MLKKDLEIVGKCHEKVACNQDKDGGRLEDESSHFSLGQILNNLELRAQCSVKITQSRPKMKVVSVQQQKGNQNRFTINKTVVL